MRSVTIAREWGLGRMTECPTCGRDDFESKKGMRQHHALTHGESLVRETHTCNECGAEFEARSNVTGQYCSPECSNAARRDDRVTVICDECGDEFAALPSQDRRFCSTDCATAYLQNRESVTCRQCGLTFRRLGSEDYGRPHDRGLTGISNAGDPTCIDCGSPLSPPAGRAEIDPVGLGLLTLVVGLVLLVGFGILVAGTGVF